MVRLRVRKVPVLDGNSERQILTSLGLPAPDPTMIIVGARTIAICAAAYEANVTACQIWETSARRKQTALHRVP
jgi:hypothetical protein